MAQWLALSLDDDFVTVVVRATLFMSAEQLLEAICDELSLETAEGAPAGELVEQLDQYAETLRARTKTLQLLVDDAHELGEEALQAILDLLERQADSSRLGEDGVKVVLFGESMLINSIQQLLPSAHITFDMEPLATEEVVDYVAFKLASAGYHGKFPLDIEVMTVIEARAQGIPGAIDAMVKDELGGAISQRSNSQPTVQSNFGFLERHLVAASVLFGALLLMLFFTLGGNNDSLESEPEMASSDSERVQTGSDPQRIQVPLDITGALNRQTAQYNDSHTALDLAAADGEKRQLSQIIEQQLIMDEVGQPPQPAEVEDIASRAAEEAAEIRQVAVNDSPPVSAAEPSAKEQKPSAEEQEPSAVGQAPSAVGQAPSAVGQAPSAEEHLRGAERALLAKSPDSYTLQLLGSRSEDNVKDFIASNTVAIELSYFESRYRDQPWFVVVHGSYPDRDTAREAIDRLPSSLRELKPWARNLSDIQADIRSLQ